MMLMLKQFVVFVKILMIDGMLGINLDVSTLIGWFSFSGWKDSFYGDLHVTDKDGVEFYTRVKTIPVQYRMSK